MHLKYLQYIVLSSVIASLYMIFPPELHINRIEIAVDDLPENLIGTKIVHLSDLHYDAPNSKTLASELLSKTIDAVNAENPALVVISGDFVMHDWKPIHGLAHQLRKIKSPTYASLGNHDYDAGQSFTIQQALKQTANVTVLRNESVEVLGGQATLVGFGDVWWQDFKVQAMNSVPKDRIVFAVVHNPDTAVDLSSWKVDVQFSGHTHGGQVVIPYFRIPVLQVLQRFFVLVRSSIGWLIDDSVLMKFIPGSNYFNVSPHWEWYEGLHKVPRVKNGKPSEDDWNWLNVNRGLGSHIYYGTPLRLFCDPEITVVTLVRSQPKHVVM